MRARTPKTLLALVLAVLLLVAGTARADGEDAAGALALTLFVPSLVVGSGSLAVAIGSAVAVSRPRPGMGWFIAGYVLGPLDLVLGALWPVVINDRTFALSMSMPLLAVGATDLGLAIAGTVKVRGLRARLAPVPIAGLGGRGEPYGGVGLRLVSF